MHQIVQICKTNLEKYSMVEWSIYKRYINAVFLFITENEIFQNDIDAIITGKWDLAVLQKSIGRFTSQIKYDMVRSIIVSKVLIECIEPELVTELESVDILTLSDVNTIKNIIKRYYETIISQINKTDLTIDYRYKTEGFIKSDINGVGGYGGTIGKIHYYLDNIKFDTADADNIHGTKKNLKNLMFCIPTILKETGWDKPEYLSIYNADLKNKITNMSHVPKILIKITLYTFISLKEIAEHWGYTAEYSIYRFIENMTIRLNKFLLGKDKTKCMRITKMLSEKGQHFYIDYQKLVSINKELEDQSAGALKILYEECDKKFKYYKGDFWSKPRCRRIVDARNNLNTKFTSKCQLKTASGGKNKWSRRKTVNKGKPLNVSKGRRRSGSNVHRCKKRHTKKYGGGPNADAYRNFLIGVLIAVFGACSKVLPLAYAGFCVSGIVLILRFGRIVMSYIKEETPYERWIKWEDEKQAKKQQELLLTTGEDEKQAKNENQKKSLLTSNGQRIEFEIIIPEETVTYSPSPEKKRDSAFRYEDVYK